MFKLKRYISGLLITIFLIGSISNSSLIVFAGSVENPYIVDLEEAREDIIEKEEVSEEETFEEDETMDLDQDETYNRDLPKIIVKYKTEDEKLQQEVLENTEIELHNFKMQSIGAKISALMSNEKIDNGKDNDAEINSIEKFEELNVEVVSLDESIDIETAIEILENDPNVEYAQLDYKFESLTVPSDPDLELQWGLKNDGQDANGKVGSKGRDINIFPVWEGEYNFEEVVVGVLDTGIDDSHSDLEDNILSGWDFVNNDESTFDEGDSAHGTQIAGIISASHNEKGIAGVAQNAKIMPLKFIQDGYGYTSDAIKAIEYAKEHNVKIINCSWGSNVYNPILKDVMEQNNDILFVCASGNTGENVQAYPASFDLPNILSVGAIDNTGKVWVKSNGGSNVDVLAPGVDIYTTQIMDKYNYTTGTSMSAAYVTAVAALYKGSNINKYSVEIAEAIKKGKSNDGMLNVKTTLDIQESIELPTYDWEEEEIPYEVHMILEENPMYSALTQMQKELLFRHVNVRQDMMEEVEKLGLAVKESIPKAIIMQRLKISSDKMMSMIENYGNENKAYNEAKEFTDFRFKYIELDEDVQIKLIDLIVSGHRAVNTLYAYVASEALDIDILEVIKKEGTNYKNIDLSMFSEEDKEMIETNLKFFYIDLQATVDYILDKNISASEFFEILFSYQDETKILLDVRNEVFDDTDEIKIQEQKYPDAAFSYRAANSEMINRNTGALVYEENIATIPGVNGLDLDLTLRYDSSEAYDSRMTSETTYKQVYEYNPKTGRVEWFYKPTNTNKINTNYSKQKIGIGSGWTFKFSSLSYGSPMKDNGYYGHIRGLNLADGSSYEVIDRLNRLEIVNCMYQNLWLYRNNYGKYVDFPNASHILEYPNGKMEFFDSSGIWVGSQDLYGNKIRVSNDYGNFTIVDTKNETITLKKTGNNYVITLPDASKITYTTSLVQGVNAVTQKKDSLNRVTNYRYSVEKMKFDFFSDNKSFNGSPMTIDCLNLTGITYPTGLESTYAYEENLGFLGEEGLYKYYRIKSREDFDGTKTYNKEIYLYSENNFTGYPKERDLNKVSSKDFTYSTTVEDINKVKTEYEFNSFHNTTSESIVVDGKIKNKTEYLYNVNSWKPFPTKITKTSYDTSIFSSTELFEYDGNGKIIKYWSPLANGTKANEYLTEYLYWDTYYHLPKSVAYKQNKDSTITENYDGYAAKKTTGKSVTKNSDTSNFLYRESYKYDFFGNLAEKTTYKNNTQSIITKYSYQDNLFLSTQKTSNMDSGKFAYDNMGRVKTSTDAKGNTTSYEYDVLGRQTKIKNPDSSSSTNVYNDDLNTLTVKNEKSNSILYTYDKFGNVKSIKDLNNAATTTFEYDNLMRLVTETSPSGAITRYTYDYLERILTKTIGGSIYTETYEYDNAYSTELSRVIKTIVGGGSTPTIKTAVYTDKSGRVAKETRFTTTNIESTTMSYEYDYVGNVIKSTNASGDSTTYEYDYAGRLIKTTNPDKSIYETEYDMIGRKISQTDPLKYKSEYIYDDLGRLLEEKAPFDYLSSSVKKYTYDKNGNIETESISNNKSGEAQSFTRTDYLYNNRNWLSRVSTYNKNGSVENYTTYLYDGVGNKTSMTTGNGKHTTKYGYSIQSQLGSITYPAINGSSPLSETYTYDKSGNMLTKTDRNGKVTTNKYDIYNRLTEVKSANAKEPITYSYGKTGAKTHESNEDFVMAFVYNEYGLLSRESSSDGINKYYKYNNANKRESFVLLQGNVTKSALTYGYDKMGRLLNVKDSGVISASYTYDLNGNRKTVAYSNGTSAAYAYNKANLVTIVENRKKDHTMLSRFDYTYYLDGNQASKKDSSGIDTTYEYDALGRLTNETESTTDKIVSKAYTYDENNNRGSLTVSGTESYQTFYEYNSNNHLKKEIKTKDISKEISEYIYDNNGNQISKTKYSLSSATSNSQLGIYILGEKRTTSRENYTIELNEYDDFNRLISVKNDEGTAKYTYRVDGMRLSKDVNGKKTTHVWDGSNIVLDFGATNDRYVRGINLIKSDTNGLYLYNAHGDVVQLINSSEDVTKVYQYDAFGVEKDKDASDTNPFRYCGEYFDKETGTIYLRARHYNPSIGRFISQDSVAGKASDPLSLNLYTYGHSNPVRFIDPSGHIKMNASQHDQNPRYAAVFAAKGNKTTFDDLRTWDRKINLSNNFYDSVKGKKIFIDPGHGGSDNGATKWYKNNCYYEKNMNLNIGMLLKEYLESYGALVYMSRTKDEFVSLDDRYAMANELNVDLFVSVHHNSSHFSWKNGATVIYPSNHDSKESAEFASRVNTTVSTYTDLAHNDIYADVRGLAVLRGTNMPAILTELGYMSSNSDMDYLVNNQDYIAQLTSIAITYYYFIEQIKQ